MPTAAISEGACHDDHDNAEPPTTRRSRALAALSKRVIRETEAALIYGLLVPQRVPRIPIVEVVEWAENHRRFWDESYERLDE
jgi:hypothetical protein